MADSKSSGAAPARSSEGNHSEHHASPAARTIRLTIRSRGPKWDETTIHAIAKSVGGFQASRHHILERAGQLRSAPVCWMEYDRRAAQFGDGTRELHVVTDLNTCCLAFKAGSVMVGLAKRIADTLEADLVNDQGKEIDGALAQSIVDAIATAQEERRAAAAVVIDEPEGTKFKQGWLSFQGERTTKRGRSLEWVYFDAPPQDYYDGQVRGAQMMLELLDKLREETTPRHRQLDVTRLLTHAAREEVNYRGEAKGNVAAPILEVAAAALHFFANTAQYRPYLESIIADAQQTRAWLEDREQEDKKKFVGRMKKAREAKATKTGGRRG